MDQLRMVLGWLKRQHFWVLCVVVAAISLVSWYGAANTLEKEKATNQNTIKSAFSAQDQLRSAQFHANETINLEQSAQNKQQAESVLETWDRLYNRQREEVLKWPNELSARFRDYVGKLKFGEPIPVDLRNHYMNYVGTHFKKLPEKVGARIMEVSEAGAGGGRSGRSVGAARSMRSGRGEGDIQEEQDDYIVEWLDQLNVRDELDMPREPSSMRIWITQENLWVYHTLLQIIANTNEAAGADRYSNAAVREIVSLEVGRPAAMANQRMGGSRIMMVAPPAAGGMEGGGREMMVSGGDASGGREGFGREGGALTEADEEAALKAGRYLDAQGNPTSEPGVEYKRLPVRMRLLMDQRWLTHLIAECASAPLQVEVKEVRVNPSGFESSGGGYDSRSGGMMGGGSMFRSRESDSGGAEFTPEPNMLPVEIQGVIYIFKEPDPALFQVSEDQV